MRKQIATVNGMIVNIEPVTSEKADELRGWLWICNDISLSDGIIDITKQQLTLRAQLSDMQLRGESPAQVRQFECQ